MTSSEIRLYLAYYKNRIQVHKATGIKMSVLWNVSSGIKIDDQVDKELKKYFEEKGKK